MTLTGPTMVGAKRGRKFFKFESPGLAKNQQKLNVKALIIHDKNLAKLPYEEARPYENNFLS